MRKKILSLIVLSLIAHGIIAQKSAMAAYAEIGGPGLASANFDMRFAKKEDGLGWRVGVGGFTINDGFGDNTSIFTIPLSVKWRLNS